MSYLPDGPRKLCMCALALCVLSTLGACNLGDSVVVPPRVKVDTGFEIEEDVTVLPDVPELPTTEAPVAGHHGCAAGGIARGSGLQLIHCTAPTDLGGPVLRGSGMTVQTGATQVLIGQ